MGKLYKTRMGQMIDMEALLLQNEHAVAIGNMQMNAKGDLLGRGGKIIKTATQVSAEYAAISPAKATSIKNSITTLTDVFETPQDAIARLKKEKEERDKLAAQEVETLEPEPSKKRKIVDNE